MKSIAPRLDGKGLRIGIVRARFNEEIGALALAGCLSRLRGLGVDDNDIQVVTIPGALEAPLALQSMAESGDYDALIALGAVIRGETYHFEVVSNEMASGISRVQLDFGLPIANGILTTEYEEQARARAAGKGSDCAAVVIEMVHLLRDIAAGQS